MTRHEALIHLTGIVRWHDQEVEAECPYCKKALAVFRGMVNKADRPKGKRSAKDKK